MGKTPRSMPAGIAAWQAAHDKRMELFGAFVEQSEIAARLQGEIDAAAERQVEIVASLVASGLSAGDVPEVIGWTASRVGQAASRARSARSDAARKDQPSS